MLYHELTVEFTAIGIPGGLRPLISSYGSGTNLRHSANGLLFPSGNGFQPSPTSGKLATISKPAKSAEAACRRRLPFEDLATMLDGRAQRYNTMCAT